MALKRLTLVDAYSCTECGVLAPPLDSLEIVAWRGGELAYYSYERDPIMLWLVCPSCSEGKAPVSISRPHEASSSRNRKAA